jgi:hypothetical protein
MFNTCTFCAGRANCSEWMAQIVLGDCVNCGSDRGEKYILSSGNLMRQRTHLGGRCLFCGPSIRQPLLNPRAVLDKRRGCLAPGGVVPGNRPQPVVLWLERHRGLRRPSVDWVEANLDLFVCFHPMAKKGNGAVARIFGNRSSSIYTQADVHRRCWLFAVCGTRCIGSGKFGMSGFDCAKRTRREQQPGPE